MSILLLIIVFIYKILFPISQKICNFDHILLFYISSFRLKGYMYHPGSIPNTFHQVPHFPTNINSPIHQLTTTNNFDPAQHQVFYSNRPLENINCIISQTKQIGGLFLGDILCLIKKQLLVNNHINAILTCLTRQQCQRSRINFDEPNIHESIYSHKIIPASDSLNYSLDIHFEQSFDFIEQCRNSGKNILVHCHAGVSRSASIVCAYLMKKQNIGMDQALELLKNKRFRVKPNQNFLSLLKNYERKLSEKAMKNLSQTICQKQNTIYYSQIVEQKISKQLKANHDSNNLKQNDFFSVSNSIGNSRVVHERSVKNNDKSLQSSKKSRKYHQFQGQHTVFSQETSMKYSYIPLYDSRNIIQGNRNVNKNQQTTNLLQSHASQKKNKILEIQSKPLKPKLDITQSNVNSSIQNIKKNGGVSYLTTDSYPYQKDQKYCYKLDDGKEKKNEKIEKNNRKKKVFIQNKRQNNSNCLFEGIKRLCS